LHFWGTSERELQYIGLITKGRNPWTDGTFTDSVVKLVG